MIKVNESRLKITKLDFSKGDSTISGVDRSKLRYRKVLLTSPGTSQAMVLPFSSDTISIPAVCKRAGFSEAWVIERASERYTKEKYTGIEKDVMLKWTKYLYPAHLDTAEILVKAIDYGNVTRKFYESYGTDLIREFYRLIDSIIDGVEKGTKKSEKKYATQYVHSRYNILQFLKDIKEANDVQIYTDPDLIGQYKRISRKLKFSGTIVPDKWCKVLGVVGNRTRANLSLSYKSKVTIDVPENTFGVVAGPRELDTMRSFCLVKDGVVWQKWIGIKTKNKDLVKKMRGAGMIKSGIVYSDEYLINLESIPAINKNDTKFITSTRMAKAEANIELAKVAGAWARRRGYMEKHSLSTCPKLPIPTTSDADKFLHDLGIYGNTYVPPKTEVDLVSRSYEAYEVVGHVMGISDPSVQAMKYINGKLNNAAVCDFLDRVLAEHTTSGRTWKEEAEMWENELQDRIDYLRVLKYRFILGKSLKFCDQRDTKVENVRVKVPITGDSGLQVFWTMCKSRIDV